MDMSKGRIRGEGHDSGVLDISGKLTAVPANNMPKHGSFIPIEAKTANTRTQNDQNTGVENVPFTIPGIQSISIMQTQKMETGTAVKIPVLNPEAMAVRKESGSAKQNIDLSDPESSNRRIYLPDLNRTNPTLQTNIQPTANMFNQVQYTCNQGDYTPPASMGTSSSQLQPDIGQVHIQPGTSLTQLQQATSLLQPGPSQNQLQQGTSLSHLELGTSLGQLQQGTSQNQLQQVQVNSMPIVNSSQVSTEDADQYVLVTVMPEGGGETVIHVYRLHGGGQSQNQVLYADPYSSQQMTVDSINTVDQQQEISSDVPLTVSGSQIVNTTQCNTAVSDLTTEIISDISNTGAEQVNVGGETLVTSEFISTHQSDYQEMVHTAQSDTQLTSGDEKMLMLPSSVQATQPDNTVLNDSNIQIIITNENKTEVNNEMTGQVSELTVTADTESENNFTKLIAIENS